MNYLRQTYDDLPDVAKDYVMCTLESVLKWRCGDQSMDYLRLLAIHGHIVRIAEMFHNAGVDVRPFS